MHRGKHSSAWALGVAAWLGAASLGRAEPAAEPPADASTAPAEPEGPAGSPTPIDASADPSEARRPRNWWIPAVELVAYQASMNLVERLAGGEEFESDWRSITHNLDPTSWTFDQDTFYANQFHHPYQGAMDMGIARSLGLSFWESLPYVFVGSLLWELTCETQPPSLNDQITTFFGGSLLGESLYRLASRVLDAGGRSPGFWREATAFVTSPPVGLNRLFFGNHYREWGLSTTPWFGEVRLGGQWTGRYEVAQRDLVASPEWDGVLDLRVTNGLPLGDWRLRRPFDFFEFGVRLVPHSFPIDALLARGLILGVGGGVPGQRGFYGLMGQYDFTPIDSFRISTSALGPCAVGLKQWRDGWSLFGQAFLGLGFGGGGLAPAADVPRQYHFGSGAVAALDLRLVRRDRFALLFDLHAWVLSGALSPEVDNWEHLQSASAGLQVRLWGPNAVGVGLTGIHRKAFYPDLPAVSMRTLQASLYYTLLSDRWWGLAPDTQQAP